MKLSDIKIDTATVEVDARQSFEVRGITFADLMEMTKDHLPAMRTIFDTFMKNRANGAVFGKEEVTGLLLDAVKEFPELIFRAIAMAADEPDMVGLVKKLPMTAQLEAVEKICRLSLKTDADIKKFQETILRLIQGTTGLFTNMTMPLDTLMTGYGKSERA
jgi:hypothetical protein